MGRWQSPRTGATRSSPTSAPPILMTTAQVDDRLFQNAVDLQNCLWGESMVGHPVEGQPDEDHNQLNVHFVPNAGHLWDIEHMGEVLEALVPGQPSKSVQK